MKIFNATQHNATSAQINAGVLDLAVAGQPGWLKDLLKFDSLPSAEEINERCEKIVTNIETEIFTVCDYAADGYAVMIGGAPWLMTALLRAFSERGIRTCFAFSQRESEEEIVDGVVVKRSQFVHKGFIVNH